MQGWSAEEGAEDDDNAYEAMTCLACVTLLAAESFRRRRLVRPTMGKSRYADFAADCVLLAGQTTDPTSKVRLLDMAAVWLRLAENGQTDHVYETHLRAD